MFHHSFKASLRPATRNNVRVGHLVVMHGDQLLGIVVRVNSNSWSIFWLSDLSKGNYSRVVGRVISESYSVLYNRPSAFQIIGS
jgi:hypothetical protein